MELFSINQLRDDLANLHLFWLAVVLYPSKIYLLDKQLSAPSEIAQTIKDCPRRISPAAKMCGY